MKQSIDWTSKNKFKYGQNTPFECLQFIQFSREQHDVYINILNGNIDLSSLSIHSCIRSFKNLFIH